MSNILTREEFKSKVKTVARRGHDQVPAWDAVLDCDAALRACIQQAVLDMEKMPHYVGCSLNDPFCGKPKAEECLWAFSGCRTHRPSAIVCDCCHDAAIDNLKKGLGEKS